MAKAAPAAAGTGGAARRGAAQSARSPERKPDMLKSGVRLEDLTGQGLCDYAKCAGVPGHVIAFLTEEKLRHECLLRVHTYLEQLDD